MKLGDWAKKENLSYMTCYRWFKEGKLPPTIKKAYQTETGTIMVELNDDNINQPSETDPVSKLLNKAFEYTQEQKSIFDFTSYVVTNFYISEKEKQKPEKEKSNNLKIKQNKAEYFEKVINEINQNKEDLKIKKDLAKIAFDLKIDLSYDELVLLKNESPPYIFLSLKDKYSFEKIDLLIKELRKHSDNNCKIHIVYNLDKIKEEYEV